MDERLVAINEAKAFIEKALSGRKPQVGIVLGSGLGKLADKIESPVVIKYSDIPHFVKSTAIGHKGNFIAGMLGGKFVIAMQGRFHFYEGYPMEKVVLPIRVMVKLGIEALFVSNAAGGVNYDYKVGDLMIIKDHINLLPNPLIGPNLEEFGPRFPDMTRPYDLKLIRLAEELSAECGIELRKGVKKCLSVSDKQFALLVNYLENKINGAGIEIAEEIEIEAEVLDERSTIINENLVFDLEEYETEIKITVQAEKGNIKIYTVKVRKSITRQKMPKKL